MELDNDSETSHQLRRPTILKFDMDVYKEMD